MNDREGKSGERERERNRKKTFYFLQKVSPQVNEKLQLFQMLCSMLEERNVFFFSLLFLLKFICYCFQIGYRKLFINTDIKIEIEIKIQFSNLIFVLFINVLTSTTTEYSSF